MTRPILQLDRINKSFGGVVAAREVCLAASDNQIHALIGPNGAGKSTLINLVAGTLSADSGSIRLGGRDITRMRPAARCHQGLARTFQISSLIPSFTALANVMLAIQSRAGHSFYFRRAVMNDPDLIDPAQQMLDKVGLGARRATPVNALSHGERRLLELAIALALGPRLLLLDEPMAGLGGDGTKRMIELLRSLKSSLAIVLVEHDMDAVFALADRVSVLVGGRVIACGSVQDVRASGDVQRAYLGQTPC